MNIHWNDLMTIKDIQNNLVIEENNFTNQDIDEFKESILYFIEDFLNQNIKLYKEYDFETIIFETLYDTIIDAYSHIFDNLDTEFDLEHHIFDAMEIYFYKNNSL